MAAATVRADYDQLKQVASAFGQNSANCKQTLQNIKSNMNTLQGGDWIGQGASAFYQEMDDSVLPTLQRLINALDTAQSSITQISTIMKNAEDQAANVLKGQGGGSGGSSAGSGGAFGGALGGLGGALGGASGGGAPGGAFGGALGGLGGALGGAAGGAQGGSTSASDQIAQLTNQATQAINSLSDVPDDALNNAVNQLGNLASQFDGILPPGMQPDSNGLGSLLSAIGSPNANQIGQQIGQQFSQPSFGSGGGGSSGGGVSGGGGGGPSGGGGGGPSGGGGGGPSGGGGSSGAAMQGFSDQALTSLMNNPNLPPGDRMLAMAIETLRRDPNAFNGALKQFVDQALGQGATNQAAQAMGGGISALAGAAGISAGGQPSQSTTDAINSLAQQYNNITSGGGAPASAGQPIVSPIGRAPSSAPSAPAPAPAANAIANLVQQFIKTVDAVLPKN